MFNTGLLKLAQSAPVTNVPLRTVLTLIVVAAILLSVLGMARGWRKNLRTDLAQIDTQVPTGANQISPKVAARFAGTTTAGNWLDRITNQELGTPRGVDLQIFDQGIFITDDTNFQLWIAKSQISKVATGQGIAGDVVEKSGMLIFTWRLGDTHLDTGVRVSRHSDHELIVLALANFPGSDLSQSTNFDRGAGA